MREIKFRAWDKEQKKMSFFVGIFHDLSIFNTNNNPKNFELMQFTGLKDKNGKEIYEGDIVEFIGHKNRVVSWTPDDHHYAGWYAIGGIRSLPIYSGKEPNTIEVIGNIYENPELISK